MSVHVHMGMNFQIKAFLLSFCLFGILISCSKISREEYESEDLPSRYQVISEDLRNCGVCKEHETTASYKTCPCGKSTHFSCLIKYFNSNEDANDYSCPICDRKMSIQDFLKYKNWNFHERVKTPEFVGLRAFVSINFKIKTITILEDENLAIFDAERNGINIIFKFQNHNILKDKEMNAIESAFVFAAIVGNLYLIKFISENYNEIFCKGDIFEAAMFFAIEAYKFESLKLLLDLDITPNFEPSVYKRFLIEAIKGDKPHILDALVKGITDLSEYQHEGKSLLSLAIDLKSEKCIGVLLLKTILPDDVNGPIELQNNYVYAMISDIIINSNVNGLKNILKLRIPIVMLRNGKHFSVLEMAAAQGSREIFNMLMESGIRFDKDQLREKIRCYYYALLHDRAEILDMMKNFDINQAQKNGLNILQYAIYFSNAKMVEKALNLGADVNLATETLGYPLHHAIFKNKKEIVTILLRNGASLEFVDKYGCNGIEIALKEGSVEVFKAITDHLGTEIYYNAEGFNTLQLAIKYGNIEMVKYFVNQGVTAIKSDGSTNFMLSKICSRENSELLDYLLGSCGANVYEQDFGRTKNSIIFPPTAAIIYGQIKNLEVLLKYGLDPNRRIKNENSTLLHQAIKSEKFDIAHLLIKYGADTNALDNLGRTAFSYVQNEETVKKLKNMDDYL